MVIEGFGNIVTEGIIYITRIRALHKQMQYQKTITANIIYKRISIDSTHSSILPIPDIAGAYTDGIIEIGGVFSEHSEMESDKAVADIPGKKRIGIEACLGVFFTSIEQTIPSTDGVSDCVVVRAGDFHKEGVVLTFIGVLKAIEADT